MDLDRYEPAMPLELLVESPWNPRKRFDETKLNELAGSIKERGVREPLLARPLGDGKYELASGHRRLRASRIAGADTAPVRVQAMDDNEFLEVLSISNLQREDIHPLEEGQGYAELLSRPGYDVAGLALKLGKSESYVSQRLKLLDLTPALQEDFLADKFPFSHALTLARLQARDQAHLRKNGLYNHRGDLVSVADLRNAIQNDIYLDLHKVPWDVHDAKLLPAAGPCTACSKRTGFQPTLFPELDAKDYCLDRPCHVRKSEAFVELRLSTVEAEAGLAPLQLSGAYGHDSKKRKPGVLYDGQWKPMQDTVEKGLDKRCGATSIGVVVELSPWGQSKLKIGQRLEVCTNQKCRVHFRFPSSSAAMSPAEQLKDLRKKREEETEQLTSDRMKASFLAGIRWPLSIDDLRLVVWGCWSRLWSDSQRVIIARRGIERPKNSWETGKVMRPVIDAMNEHELAGLLFEIAISGQQIRSEDEDSIQHVIESRLLRSEVDGIRAQAVADMAKKYNAREAKLQAPPAAKKTAAKKAAAKKKAGKK